MPTSWSRAAPQCSWASVIASRGPRSLHVKIKVVASCGPPRAQALRLDWWLHPFVPEHLEVACPPSAVCALVRLGPGLSQCAAALRGPSVTAPDKSRLVTWPAGSAGGCLRVALVVACWPAPGHLLAVSVSLPPSLSSVSRLPALRPARVACLTRQGASRSGQGASRSRQDASRSRRAPRSRQGASRSRQGASRPLSGQARRLCRCLVRWRPTHRCGAWLCGAWREAPGRAAPGWAAPGCAAPGCGRYRVCGSRPSASRRLILGLGCLGIFVLGLGCLGIFVFLRSGSLMCSFTSQCSP